jgi:hypothetical protein
MQPLTPGVTTATSISLGRPHGMRIIQCRQAAAALLVSALASGRADAQARWASLDDFLTRGIRLSAQELATLGRAETVARLLPTADGDDIAVFGAVQLEVPRMFFADRQRDVMRALRTPTRTRVQRFSDPAVATDVQALEITGDDLKELRGCRPESCTFKLPATDMERFRATIGSAPDARARVAEYAAQRMVEYVNDYRSRGNAAMLIYDDRGSVRSSDALIGMLRDSSHVFTAVPSLGQHLVEYPRSTLPGATEVIFWSRDEMPHLRPVLRITHQTVWSPPERTDLTIVAAKQIYANHYFEAGLEVLAAVDRSTANTASDGAGITVVAIRRYRFDHLPGGLLNIRGRVANGLRDNVLADLRRLKRDTETEWGKQGSR